MKSRSEDLIYMIQNNRIYLKSIKYEYQHNKNCLNKRPHGLTGQALANTYYETIGSELHKLEQLVLKISQYLKCNFNLELKVLSTGEFDFDNLNIQIKRSFDLRNSNGEYKKSVSILYDSLEKILPFADHIYDVHLYSTNYHLSHAELFLFGTYDNIEQILSTEAQGSVFTENFRRWMEVLNEFNAYTKEHYACSVNIPCDEGVLFYENGIFSLTKREFITIEG